MEIIVPRKILESLGYDEVLAYFKDTSTVLPVSVAGEILFEERVVPALNSNAHWPNLYGIYVREKYGRVWKLKYIGQRNSKEIRQRLREHLVKSHGKTGSQRANVQNELGKGCIIGLKLAWIQPDELRHYYEARLLQDMKPIEWNKHH